MRTKGLLSAIAILILVGCSRNTGPERHSVTGQVTHNGSPVVSGTITFDPDSSKGAKGPQGFARIVDGRFDTTQSGKGSVGGPHVVRIVGELGDDPAKPGNVFYVDHRLEIELPDERYETKIELPDEAVASRPKIPEI